MQPTQITSLGYACVACACFEKRFFLWSLLLVTLTLTSICTHARPYDVRLATPRSRVQAVDVALAHLTVLCFVLRYYRKALLWGSLSFAAYSYECALPRARRRFAARRCTERAARRELVAWHCAFHVVSVAAMLRLLLQDKNNQPSL